MAAGKILPANIITRKKISRIKKFLKYARGIITSTLFPKIKHAKNFIKQHEFFQQIKKPALRRVKIFAGVKKWRPTAPPPHFGVELELCYRNFEN